MPIPYRLYGHKANFERQCLSIRPHRPNIVEKCANDCLYFDTAVLILGFLKPRALNLRKQFLTFKEKGAPDEYLELELDQNRAPDDANQALLILNPIHPAGQSLFKLFKESIQS